MERLDLNLSGIATSQGELSKASNQKVIQGLVKLVPSERKVTFKTRRGLFKPFPISKSRTEFKTTPLACGGTDEISNLRVLCEVCNRLEAQRGGLHRRL
ncbi:MAG: HNH endonuclease [Pseudobdellovibrionaceae bacterium]